MSTILRVCAVLLVLAASPAVAAPPVEIDAAVPLERGHVDIPFDGMVALPSARFLTTALVQPLRTVEPIAPDATAGDPWDAGSGFVRTHPVAAGSATPRRFRFEARVTGGPDGMALYVGRDLDGDAQPDADEVLCQASVSGGAARCVATESVANGRFWLLLTHPGPLAASAMVESSVIDLCAGPGCTQTPRHPDRFVATGPGSMPADVPFAVRIEYGVHVFTKGRVRVGVLQVQTVPGTTVAEIPVRLTRTGTGNAPYALRPLRSYRTALSGGAAHERLFVDVPPGVSSLWLRTSEHSDDADLSLYVARVDDIPPGPVVGNAPARDAPGVVSTRTVGAGGMQVSVPDPVPGRYFVTPVNHGAGVESFAVTAVFYGDTKPRIGRGSYYNPDRPGHGVFLYESGGDVVMLWYTYLQDGTPTWYYAQGPAAFERRAWEATAYRAAWHGFDRTLTDVGSVVVTAIDEDTVVLSYNLDGFTGSETMTKWLTGCPYHAGERLAVSAHWYDPALPGYGYSVQVHPQYEFIATFAYDGHGVPRFLAAERAGPFAVGDTALPLQQLTGFAPLGPWSPPARTVVGALGRTYGVSTIESIGAQATFAHGLPGSWTRTADVARLSTFSQGCAP